MNVSHLTALNLPSLFSLFLHYSHINQEFKVVIPVILFKFRYPVIALKKSRLLANWAFYLCIPQLYWPSIARIFTQTGLLDESLLLPIPLSTLRSHWLHMSQAL